MRRSRSCSLALLFMLLVNPTFGRADGCRNSDGVAETRPSVCPTVERCNSSACATVAPEPSRLDPARYRASTAKEARPSDLRVAAALDELLETIRANHKTPALVAAVWQAGEITAAGAAGVRAAGESEPARVTDRFHFGSCGKAMTATLAGLLVERGVISWTTTIEDTFPEIAPEMHASYRAATLHQLLSHRSGLPQGRPPQLYGQAGPLPAQRRELVWVVGQLDPVGMPGTVFHYSDLGYLVAGAMMEKATGTSWETLIIEQIAKPLGLTTLGFGAPGSAETLSEPRGHVRRGDVLEAVAPGPQADGAVAALGPAGTIHASVLHWAAFAGSHIGPGSGERRLRIGRENFDALHADPYRQDYALGWGLQKTGSRTDLVHSGSCGRWAAVVRVVPQRDTAIVVASNYGGQSAFLAVGAALEILVERYVQAP